MLKEFCAENFTNIPAAISAGAKRIELCDNLYVGGTTVSIGVLEATVEYAHEKNIPVNAIIRPRGGNFIYNDTELRMMTTDVLEFKKSEVDGIVVGMLTEDNTLDYEGLSTIFDLAEGLSITFHMAFDELSLSDQFKAIDWLAENGVERILTHGGPAGTNILDNLAHLKELIAYAKDRLIILPGGGVTSENADKIASQLNVKELHGTKIVSF
ncbi:copper homeostasis protein CutC [Enterococcus timonensis]|uniref:copper homeostasis protein CutC n=1 Tax=Enterococcus timonensis TaxID=1852364 RepID=UPI0008D9EFEF|nr:copper homeostasis protein CutC [Enterococcus timonensis]